MPRRLTEKADLKEKTIKLFIAGGHALEKQAVNRHSSMWLYQQCPNCNISIYLWSQNGMPKCSGGAK